MTSSQVLAEVDVPVPVPPERPATATERRRGPSGSDQLTAREREVLGLLTEGRSDREIAEALCISPKTVGTHLTHILGKLGVPSRAAAIAHVHRHGLA